MTRRRVLACAGLWTIAFVAAVLVPEPAHSHKPITTSILFKNEIAQIFQRKCFQCHSENNLSMSLTTYTDARPWARAIREEVLERKMPPWQAVPGYGHFANDISLNTREKEIILSWADGGAPSGVLKAEESVPPVYVPPAPSWEHGTPDLVVPIGAQQIASGSPFELKRIVVTTKLPADKRVRGISLKQGDRRVVRHAAFYDEATRRWIGGWTPWQTLSQLPDRVAIRLPANARIAVEIGYSGADDAVTDNSELGLYFDAGNGAVADGLSIAAPEKSIAPGVTSERLRAETTIAADTSVLALWPNPSAGARSIEITATSPDGLVTPLLWVKDYRHEWRSPYLFATPVALSSGTRLSMTTYFDNVADQAAVARAQAWVVTAGASRRAAAPRK